MRTVWTEIDKTLKSPITVIMVLAVAGVCMLSEGYIDVNAHHSTVLSLMVSHNAELFASDVSMNRIEMWRIGFGTWAYILIPLFLTFGYVYALSEERLHGGIQFYLIREGRTAYCISKTISAMISGGVILLAGYILYGLVVAMVFPGLSSYPAENAALYLEQTGISAVIPYILFRCLWVFLYGMMISIFGYLVSVLFTEKYILLCLPMMLSYVYSSFYSRIESHLLDQEQWNLQEKFQVFDINNMIQGVGIKSRFATLTYLLVLYLCSMVLFLIKMKRNEVR